jgi:hypothetical protein
MLNYTQWVTFKDNIENRIFDFRCLIYMQNNKTQIEVPF